MINQSATVGKGNLALLENTLKKESKKKKFSLKNLLNSQAEVNVQVDSDLSSIEDADESIVASKKKSKIFFTAEMSKHYDEVIDFVSKNYEPDFVESKSDNSNVEKKTDDNEESVAKNNSDFEDISDNELIVDDSPVPEIEENLKSSSVQETKENGTVESTDVNNSFTYEGSPYLVLDNLEENQVDEEMHVVTTKIQKKEISSKESKNRSRFRKTIEEEKISKVEVPVKRSRNKKDKKLEVKSRKRKRSLTDEDIKPCKVQIIDCKYTLLQSNVSSKVLRKAGISRIRNLRSIFPNSFDTDAGKKLSEPVKKKDNRLVDKDDSSETENSTSNEKIDRPSKRAKFNEPSKELDETMDASKFQEKDDDNLSSDESEKSTSMTLERSVSPAKPETIAPIEETVGKSEKQKKSLINCNVKLSQAQVVVEKIKIPVKVTATVSETAKLNDNVETDKPNRTTYTHHTDPILHIKVKRHGAKKNKK